MAELIIYDLGSLSNNKKVKFSRELFGYTDRSNKSRYRYKRKGVVDEITYFKLLDTAIVVKSNRSERKLTDFLKKYKVKYKTYRISVRSSEFKR